MTRARHRLVSLTLVCLLTAPAAWGRPSPRRSPAPSPRPVNSLLAFFSDWLGFGPPESWLKAGCMVDPFGRCVPEAAAGCAAQANGGCAANAAADAGCLVDPNGRCSTDH